ncbi:MAG: aminopeptidase [Thermoleophilia bacterium]|nr:aminopeptidase [Thermoleophilia bacterium]
MADPRIHRLADLAVAAGANVRPGQVVSVTGRPGYEEMVRAIADAAYRRGAKYVDIAYFDPHVKLARLRHAEEDTLGWVPPWLGDRARAFGEMGGANIAITGVEAPGIFDGIDPARAGRDRLPSLREWIEVVMAGGVSWTVVPFPTTDWAGVVFPDLPPQEGLAVLWDRVAAACRLDAPDPVAAWRARAAELTATAASLNARRLAGLRFAGPGTDLRVGLFPSSRWLGGEERTSGGIVHLPNIPTEEVFTTPDPERTEGYVTSTMPLEIAGTVITGLRVRFEGGRAVAITADHGAEVLRSRAGVDDGADRLGEVALVDGTGRIGPLGTVFFETLLDENAASHIALGAAYPSGVADEADRERANTSEIHIDFMVGGPEVTVYGIDGAGTESVLLADGAWAA